ncbi:MAG TPA: hypothetical protein VM532_09985 [Burkholderiales bacterium]|nr:hypothetical protein [Burkholderiales bacterium]
MRCIPYWVAALVLLAGCAAPTKYIEPDASKPARAAGPTVGAPGVVDHPQTAAWQQLISGAPKAGFLVERPNLAAWTLNLRYTGDPKEYIDCGRVVSKVKTAKGEHTYDFPAAKAYQQYQLQKGNKVFLVDRRMNIEIRTTVSLEPVTQSSTRLKMDSQYIATRDQAVRGGGAKPFGMTDSISFDAAGGATFPNAATRCRGTGKFESDVLAVARRG